MTIKPQQIPKILEICRNANVVPFIWGSQGIGKSQIIKQYSDNNNLDFIDLRLSLMEPGDLIGMPVIENNKTVFKKPQWFPEEKSKGVLFLDELNRANEDIHQAIFQLILDKRINGHILPKDWQIVVAGNYGDDYIVQELDPALLSRFCHLYLIPDENEWLKWSNNKWPKQYTDIIIGKSILFNKDDIKRLELKFDEFLTAKVQPTPRSNEMLLNILNHNNDLDILNPITKGLLGTVAGELFLKHLDKDNIIFTVDDIIGKNKTLINKVVKHENCFNIVANANSLLLDVLIKNNLNQTEIENTLFYLQQLPKEIGFSIMRTISKQYSSILTEMIRIDFETTQKLIDGFSK